jgi:hypothetical protein
MPAGVTISQLPPAAEVLGTDLLEIERSGASYRVSVDELIDYLGLEEFAQTISDILG